MAEVSIAYRRAGPIRFLVFPFLVRLYLRSSGKGPKAKAQGAACETPEVLQRTIGPKAGAEGNFRDFHGFHGVLFSRGQTVFSRSNGPMASGLFF